MFILFTPFTYIFLSVYLLVLFFLFTINNFYLFWLYIEIAMLLFIGMSYTIFVHSYTQLMLYFLIQTLASFGILVFYTLDYSSLFYFSLFLKLGMFPFMSWYINVLFRFPSFTLLISSTLHNLPPLFLFAMVYTPESLSFVLVSIILSVLVGSFFIITILDLRYLLVVSSIANNSFLLIGLISGSFWGFALFFSLYTVTMFLVLFSLNGLLKPLIFPISNNYTITLVTLFLLLNLAALPPLPMFLANFIVIYNFLVSSILSFPYLIFIVVVNAVMIASYCQLFMNYITQVYSNSSFYYLY